MIRQTPMHQQLRLLSALWVMTALTLFCPIAFADDEEARSEAAAHLLQAELALQGSEFREAAREYRKAAQISESVDVARCWPPSAGWSSTRAATRRCCTSPSCSCGSGTSAARGATSRS
jgi:hypothetical protein